MTFAGFSQSPNVPCFIVHGCVLKESKWSAQAGRTPMAPPTTAVHAHVPQQKSLILSWFFPRDSEGTMYFNYKLLTCFLDTESIVCCIVEAFGCLGPSALSKMF